MRAVCLPWGAVQVPLCVVQARAIVLACVCVSLRSVYISVVCAHQFPLMALPVSVCMSVWSMCVCVCGVMCQCVRMCVCVLVGVY